MEHFVKLLKILPAIIIMILMIARGNPVEAEPGDLLMIGGPGYRTVHVVVIDPSSPETVYIGTEFIGIQKSTNGGVDWDMTNSGLANFNVLSMVINPQSSNILYAGTSCGGVYKSTNSGGSWAAANSGMETACVRALVIDPVSQDTLYAGTEQGVFKSTNAAGAWSLVNNGLANLDVSALAIDPLTPATLYAGSGYMPPPGPIRPAVALAGNLYKSTNGGQAG